MPTRCVFEGCETMGEPQEGFDFFACEPCLEKLERMIQALHEQMFRERSTAPTPAEPGTEKR